METTRERQKNRKTLKSLKPVCGDCVGFCTERLKSSKTTCSEVGTVETSKICSSFQPDVNNLKDLIATDGGFVALAKVVDTLPDSSLRALGAMIMREDRTRQAGYKIGQVVYVRYRGLASSNYLSNFMEARIMFVDSKVYKLMSVDGKCVLTFNAGCAPHIMSRVEFKELRASMLDKGRLCDPDVSRTLSRKLRAEEDYELGITNESKRGLITTIDTVFKENKLPRKGSLNDLTTIVANIEKGFKAKDVSETYTDDSGDRRTLNTRRRSNNRRSTNREVIEIDV